MRLKRWLSMMCALAMLTLVVSACGRWTGADIAPGGAKTAPGGAETVPGGADIAPAPTVTSLPVAGDVLLSATLEAPATLDNGAALPITFTLTNHGDADLYVLTWLTPFEGIANEIFRVARDGEILLYKGLLVMRGDPTEDDYLFLNAGASASATVDLATVYDLSQAGVYTIDYIAAIQDIAASKEEMVETIDDLKQIIIPSNTITVTLASTVSGHADSGPGVTSEAGEAGMAQYVNEDYGFAFRYPTTWTLEEAGAQMVMLTQDGLRLAIAFQAPGSDPPRLGGLPSGELRTVGTMVFMGEEVNKQAVVYEDRVKVLLCDARAGSLLFAFRLDDVIAADYEAVDISEAAEQDMEEILASFELLSSGSGAYAPVPTPSAPPPDIKPGLTITGTVQDVALSARIITLAEPVPGFETIALTEGCQVVFMSGGWATLRDLRPGAQIEAQGQPGNAQSFLADRLLIWNDGS